VTAGAKAELLRSVASGPGAKLGNKDTHARNKAAKAEQRLATVFGKIVAMSLRAAPRNENIGLKDRSAHRDGDLREAARRTDPFRRGTSHPTLRPKIPSQHYVT
jgi:hypothetical protein